MTEPKADLVAALNFLKRWKPAGPWVLSAIRVDKEGIETKTFDPDSETYCLGFLNKHGDRNIYFHVNSTGPLTKKAEKKHVKSVDWFHLDIDPRSGENLDEERKHALGLLTDNLPKGVPSPTVIIFSGGGYQAFWKLEEPIIIDGDVAKAAEAERYTRKLETLFEADRCHNIDRIMRLPGTVNWPDAKKVKKERVPTLATLYQFNDGIYTLGAFTKAEATATATAKAKVTSGGAAVRFAVEELKARGLADLTRVVIAQGDDPQKPTRFDGDRSRAVFYVCCEMVRSGFTDAEIVGVISDPAWAISAHVLEQKRAAYAGDQAAKARAHVKGNRPPFITDKKDNPYKDNQDNIRIAVAALGVKLSHDTFADRLLIEGLPGFAKDIQDPAVDRLWLTVDKEFGFRPDIRFFTTVIQDEARRASFNPVCDYLDSLTWDGTPRVDEWLPTYGKAESNDYVRAVGSLMMMAAVRRARQPGCKFDEMTVLVCPAQGTNKSSALAALVPNPDWFSDSLPLGADDKIIIERMSGVWIGEAPELKGHRKGGTDHQKSFLSKTHDRARMAWGRLAVIKPRSFIVVGTTNDTKFLIDPTGNRRYWPVPVKRFNVDAIRRDRDQLWAEAAHREALPDASIRLDPALYKVAAAAQTAHEVDNPFTEVLARALGNSSGKIRSADCWDIVGVPAERRTQDHNVRLGAAMRSLGFQPTRLRFGHAPECAYLRGSADHTIEIKLSGGRWQVPAKEQGTVAVEEDEIPF